MKNSRDFPKRCKCSLHIFGGNLRAQITHKNMEVIYKEIQPYKREKNINYCVVNFDCDSAD